MAFAQNRKWNYCHVTQHYVIYVSFSLTFLEVGCMGNFLINQKIKKIKEIKDFDSFDYLINWDGVHTIHPSWTAVRYRQTDKHFWRLNLCTQMVMILFHVIARIKKSKDNKNQMQRRLNNEIIKKIKLFDFPWFFYFLLIFDLKVQPKQEIEFLTICEHND